MNQLQLQQLECLLVLAEELHFGHTAARLGCSQSRVSQLVSGLESRVGARLVERTSRRVALTRFGAQFVDEVRPAYAALDMVFTNARQRAGRGTLCELRIGFHGSVYEEITLAFRRLRAEHDVAVMLSEIPLGSPFQALLDGRVDAVVVELPVHEAALSIGFRFPPQDQLLAVSAAHPLAARGEADIEQLANLDLLHRSGDAPEYWMNARVPRATPAGAPIRSSTGITTIQEGLALVAGGEHAMLLCRPLAQRTLREDVRYLSVDGLAPSQLALVWRTEHAGEQLASLAELLHDEFAADPPERLPACAAVS
ncbi:LysR family transcriptional regulator [Actinoalloteichus hymeniacidonis]|uniref:Transcriptional regulator, LysR family n=1 Tax=Actinoalloteichus hymeniacidonis TaxID=340345 RepID=A0AAC9HM98_9PSEU|nr:LysR family transcriptional regulator [Actinoalloteichus hymeniacidonis]AOS61942.1 transcriptional regulator, LysR family [Actinoalloteichus hymeniacidonis]MBB5910038.1 DNA-binding transcriptional LysR family regulator [Actinoalloteichus hymeniacidonis]